MIVFLDLFWPDKCILSCGCSIIHILLPLTIAHSPSHTIKIGQLSFKNDLFVILLLCELIFIFPLKLSPSNKCAQVRASYFYQCHFILLVNINRNVGTQNTVHITVKCPWEGPWTFLSHNCTQQNVDNETGFKVTDDIEMLVYLEESRSLDEAQPLHKLEAVEMRVSILLREHHPMKVSKY